MTEIEKQILLNQIAIMAALKEQAVWKEQVKYEASIIRFEDAIRRTVEVLKKSTIPR